MTSVGNMHFLKSDSKYAGVDLAVDACQGWQLQLAEVDTAEKVNALFATGFSKDS